jgi:hypothetical protein
LIVATPKPQVPTDGLALNASERDPAAFIRTMYNLIYLAFKTDSTRYATYMLQSMNAEWGKISIALGLGTGHHVLAHNAVQGGGHLDKLGRYDKFQADLLAEFITKLADTPEGDGRMLDNTIVLYGSSNSQTHVNTDYPLMLVGGEKLGLRQGALHACITAPKYFTARCGQFALTSDSFVFASREVRRKKVIRVSQLEPRLVRLAVHEAGVDLRLESLQVVDVKQRVVCASAPLCELFL